jgi:hypothetical protein
MDKIFYVIGLLTVLFAAFKVYKEIRWENQWKRKSRGHLIILWSILGLLLVSAPAIIYRLYDEYSGGPEKRQFLELYESKLHDKELSEISTHVANNLSEIRYRHLVCETWLSPEASELPEILADLLTECEFWRDLNNHIEAVVDGIKSAEKFEPERYWVFELTKTDQEPAQSFAEKFVGKYYEGGPFLDHESCRDFQRRAGAVRDLSTKECTKGIRELIFKEVN